ncbi:hypothetical protein NLJ89_g3205 [Agrocybe chaxingu]|uniref:Peptidase A1 domain-containing protein n=1 Tax=Agrocybe chaxingu TaxID=84603 RepID=A0A9W8K4F9_9AGAR|nr:hypothetical protein NLJ89_g3205 [Agrocybe chaxingu]
MRFGVNSQQFSLQVDTGSSDLWVASTSCSTSSCGLTKGRLYDPSGATPTGVDFTIPYLSGLAAGPVVWDRVSVGGYTINTQALAAANDVRDEPLAPNFSGILGLALPLNSIIASSIAPVTNNNPDGAAWASNLFSITPIDQAPASRFLSLALSRPGSDQVPAVLGIGRHPAALVPDPSKIEYSIPVSDRPGILFWKVSVRAITVYVNGEARGVSIGRSATGAVFPSAILDSGVPLILTTSTIANAIYGAIGVSPASDGQYYVPCTTPLNMTVTIDNRPEIPLHPLDLTAEPPQGNRAQFCIGLIQAADAQLTRPDSPLGDMILGVPFMRNVYTVMAYTVPNADGSFTPIGSTNSTDGALVQMIRPRLGLLSLTEPTRALSEFNTVRVLNQPISSGVPTTSTGSGNNTKTVPVGGKRLSIGIIVLIGLLSFFALCCILFAIRWFLMRRKFRKAAQRGPPDADEYGTMDRKSAYLLARRGVGSGGTLSELTEDELRQIRYNNYLRKERILSDATMSSDNTRVSYPIGKDGYGQDGYLKEDGRSDEEFGFRNSKPVSAPKDGDEEVWDPRTGLAWGDDTLVGTGTRAMPVAAVDGAAIPLVTDQDRSPPSSPEAAFFPHSRQYNDGERPGGPHKPMRSIDVPLLSAHKRVQSDEETQQEISLPSTHVSHSARHFSETPTPTQPGFLPHPTTPSANTMQEDDGLGELGVMNGIELVLVLMSDVPLGLASVPAPPWWTGLGISRMEDGLAISTVLPVFVFVILTVFL